MNYEKNEIFKREANFLSVMVFELCCMVYKKWSETNCEVNHENLKFYTGIVEFFSFSVKLHLEHPRFVMRL